MSNLKDKRKQAGLTQAELASRAEVNLRMVQYYEEGKKDINMAAGITLYKLAKTLDVAIEDLLELPDLSHTLSHTISETN